MEIFISKDKYPHLAYIFIFDSGGDLMKLSVTNKILICVITITVIAFAFIVLFIPKESSAENETNADNTAQTDSDAENTDEELLKLAEEYATKQIPNVQNQQDYWYQHNSDGAAESSVEIVSARVETFEYMLTYNGYIIYKYNGSFKSNDPEDIFSIDEWELRDDGWYTDLRPQYMIFRDDGVPELLGVMLCEFTPNGNSEMFYSDLDRWLADYENDSRNLK